MSQKICKHNWHLVQGSYNGFVLKKIFRMAEFICSKCGLIKIFTNMGVEGKKWH